jgi:hypothetical protein
MSMGTRIATVIAMAVAALVSHQSSAAGSATCCNYSSECPDVQLCCYPEVIQAAPCDRDKPNYCLESCES